MQKIATRIFIFASLAFGVLGILIVLFELDKDNKSELDILLMKSFMITVFIILPSFALSVAGKYLNRTKQ
jgi:cadmium resistance protein CadD (predicted permease)